MVTLNLPAGQFSFNNKKGKTYILDEIRKKYILLTPEEWVRQHFVKFLISYKNCPSGLISLEKSFLQNDLTQRSDIVVYDRSAKALLLVECKAPEVPVNQIVFDQVLAYNLKVKAPFLVVTNGLKHFCIYQDFSMNQWKFLEEIPDYTNLQLHGI